MVDLERLETDLYNEIMEMRAKEKKREEDRENTVKTLKFAAVIGMYVVAAILVSSFLFIFLRYQFPEYFDHTGFSSGKAVKNKEADHNITVSNVSPVAQNVVINIYNNGVLSHVPVKRYKEGNKTVIDIGKPEKKKKTIEALKKEILEDKNLTEKEKKKKILELFGTKYIKYSGPLAGNEEKSRACNNSVVDSVNADNIALRAYGREDLGALSRAIEVATKKSQYSSKVCKNVMSEEQLEENIATSKQHLILLRSYERLLREKSK